MHDQYVYEGCQTFEKILGDYSSYAIWKWIKKGYCADFEERWEYLGMDQMSCQQIEQIYENLEVKQELQEVLAERAEECEVACTYAEDEEENEGGDGGNDGEEDTLNLEDPDQAFELYKGADDALSAAEFDIFYHSSELQNTEQTSKDLFDKYDRDKDGLINLDEWKCLFCEILQGLDECPVCPPEDNDEDIDPVEVFNDHKGDDNTLSV